MIDFSAYRMIDLTIAYDETVSGFRAEEARRLDRDGWNAQTLQLYSHAGTHMDAPVHFGGEGTIDELAPSELMGPAWVADLSGIAPAALILPDHLGSISQKAKPGDSLLLRTGWSRHLPDRSMYRDRLPRISPELAEWCGTSGIKMLGVEPPSVADVNNLDEVTQIHTILFRNQVTIIEGLTDLELISRPKVWLIALPLKIKSGDGAPARVLVLEER